MKNICFILYDYTQNGGAERATSKLANALIDRCNITIISVFNSNPSNAYEDNDKISYYRIIDSKGSIPKNIYRITKSIRKVIKRDKIDIVLAVDMATAFLAVLGTRFSKTKLIVCDRSSCFNDTMYQHFALRLYAWTGVVFSDILQVMTEEGKQGWIKKYNVNGNKIVVIPNWIDNKAITEYPYYFDQNRIISVGRATPEKNYEELIRIAEKVRPYAEGWQWHIWGDFRSEYGEKLLKEIDARGLSDFLVHKGKTNQIYEIYHNYSFFVLTSKFEGMPNVILEAQGSKLPTISYDCKTGPSELIQNGVNGFVIHLNDTDQMVETIIRMIHNKQLADNLSSNSNINYEKYSEESIMKRWDALLLN